MSDVSARARLQSTVASLRASEDRYRALAENTRDVLFEIDAVGRVVYVSSRVAELGFEPASLVGRPLLDFAHPKARDAVAVRLAEVLEQRRPVAGETRIRRADGGFAWFEVSVTPYAGPGGELRAVCVARPSEERRRAERAVRAQGESLDVLNRFAEAFYRALDQETLCQRAVDEISAYSGVPMVSVWARPGGAGPLARVALSGVSPRVARSATPVPAGDDPLLALVVAERIPVRIDDVAVDPRVLPEIRAALGGLGLRSLVLLPLLHGDDLVGALALLAEQPIRFEPLVEDTLQAACRTLAGALANAEVVLRLRAETAERESAQRALRDSEERFRALLDHSSDLIFELDLEGRALWVGPNVTEQLGVPPEVLLGRSLLDRLHPDDRAAAGELLVGILEGSGEGSMEARVAHADGRWLWYEGRGRVYRLPDGQRRAVVAGRPIGERRRADEELRAKTESLEALNEIADTLYRSLDLDALGRRVVDAVSAYTGIPSVSLWTLDAPADELELVAVSAGARLPATATSTRVDRTSGLLGLALGERRLVAVGDVKQDARANPAIRRQLLELGMRSVIVLPLLYQEQAVGALGLAAPTPEPLSSAELETLDSLGKTIAAALVNAHHVTRIESEMRDREQAESALRESEARFRQLAENTEGAFFLFDVVEQRLLYASPSCERLLGIDPERLYEDHRAFLEAVHPEDRGRVERGYDPEVAEREYRVVRADGSVRWVTDRSQPIRDADGRLVRLAGYVQDVTARKELEEQLRQSQKMEAVGSLAGGIAHDFNNILTAIHGYSELLLSEGDDAATRRESAEEILRAAERATSLTRQLLTFSRRQVARPEVVDVDRAVHELEGMLRRLIGEDVELFVDPRSGRAVEVDRGQLEQVIVNLVLNARDAMPGGGTLTVSTRLVEILPGAPAPPEVSPGWFVRLSVRDTGSGVDARVQERIFEPFFTTKPPGKGTGLGLSTAYGIVRQAGGRIRLHSASGAGTTFEIDLPAVSRPRAPRPEKAAAAASSAGISGETVLLAEDEPAVRALARRILERAGYQVLVAADGQEALALAELHGEEIAAVVTDLVMPRIGGLELRRRLREMGLDVPVLVTSGYAEEAGQLRAQADVAFLDKPFTPDALQASLRALLEAKGPESGR